MNYVLLAFLNCAGLYAQEQDSSSVPTEARSAALHREDNAYLFRHNPFYFAYGNPISKLQLSFRVKPLTEVPVYLAYSQLMFWSLQKRSKPFQDQTFNPELFYRLYVPSWVPVKSVDLGWMHQSNGKGGEDSRSYNSLYVRANFEKEIENWVVRTSLTGSYVHALDETNRDIQKFVGPVILKVALIQMWQAWIDKSEISLQASPAGKFSQDWGHGGYQAAIAFRIGKLKLVPSIYVQYYSGYAESLINYDQYVRALRVGVIF